MKKKLLKTVLNAHTHSHTHNTHMLNNIISRTTTKNTRIKRAKNGMVCVSECNATVDHFNHHRLSPPATVNCPKSPPRALICESWLSCVIRHPCSLTHRVDVHYTLDISLFDSIPICMLFSPCPSSPVDIFARHIRHVYIYYQHG